MSHDHHDVLIIGGGFSGASLAIQLAERGIASKIVESRHHLARGAAYSTHADEHLLNVPAGKMGLSPSAVHDFADRLADEGDGPQDFVSRRRFGDYVESELALAVAARRVGVVRDRAVAARRRGGRWQVTLASGDEIEGAALVLANGNQPPAPPPVPGLDGDRRIDDPWSDEGRARIAALAEQGGDVLLIGTGLTMVDVVLTLDRLGHRGRVTALSRRGQVPRAHVACVVPEAAALDEVPERLSDALRWIRRRVDAGSDWRAVIDGLRPITQALWQRLDLNSKERFLRHLRPWWDVHRHRIAPKAAATVARLIGDGRLDIVAGRVGRAVEADDGARIEILRRGGGSGVVEARAVINCTGPLGRIDQSDDPLLKQMLAESLVTTDPLGLGLSVMDDDRLPNLPRAWAVGPMTKGHYWEITAVPDIRVQVQRIANAIEKAMALERA